MIGLVEDALAGQRRSLARLVSLVEEDGEEGRRAVGQVYSRTGRAQIIGLTGPPGSGKSTLLAQVAAEYRRRGLTVGVVAVDPTSPFSGGAILGDRIRMRALSGDSGVFIRSMATRGSLGGLARHTADVVRVLDACGFQRILVETVGAGQTEVDIARSAHTTLVIQVPGLGDEVQSLKAGLLEIADILVVNKADLSGADRTLAILQALVGLRLSTDLPNAGGWATPILKTIATTGQGCTELVDAVDRHVAYLRQTGSLAVRERERLAAELQRVLSEELLSRLWARLGPEGYQALLDSLLARETDPYAAARELLASIAL